MALPLARHADSNAHTLNGFTFFPTHFQGKERLLSLPKAQGNATIARIE